MRRRFVFELSLSTTLLLLGVALADAGVSDWGLAITGACLLGATLALRPRTAPLALSREA
ncbi:hypothetical protein [Ferrimonas balearica]|uniref:hypothetical protein n=1 Tax=Ferrimonas balearica TaxID=44012 RepID=UPI001C99126D|nr:hypothetical protein [Ferrimonas balearica]MBY5991787.1 hypothetical protein [Ferrimonas balearica]